MQNHLQTAINQIKNNLNPKCFEGPLESFRVTPGALKYSNTPSLKNPEKNWPASKGLF
jgi:hypothetical protein